MVALIGDNPAATANISQLIEHLTQAGAWFNQDLTLAITEQGEVSVYGSASDKVKNYMRVPVSIMPQLKHFQLTVTDDLMIDCETLVANPAEAVMALIIALYNQTGKLDFWRQHWPLQTLRKTPELLNHLLKSRSQSPKLKQYLELQKEGAHDQALLDSFIGSRAFNLRPQWTAGLSPECVEGGAVLLPIIDFLNHRFSAEPFDLQAQEQTSMRTFSRPDDDTGELFIRYNTYDAVDTYLYYGFVDTQAPWLNSVPMSLNLGDYHIEVIGGNAKIKGTLPPAIKDIRAFLPVITKDSDSDFRLSKLTIPGEKAPRALRRTLAFAIQRMVSLPLSQDRLQTYVLNLEAQVLEYNQNYWLALDDHLNQASSELTPSAQEMLSVLVNRAQQLIADYKSRLNLV